MQAKKTARKGRFLLRVGAHARMPESGMATKPPRTLATERLLLRAPTDADVAAIFEYASDPDVTRLMDWERLTNPSQAKEFLARCAAWWAEGSEFTWVITEKGVDAVVGAISLRPRARDADFGYVLDKRCWGRGYATEASRAVTKWA